jgi:hypothetical protein
MVNYKSKLVPEVNELLNTVEYRGEKFFNLSDIYYSLEEIEEKS